MIDILNEKIVRLKQASKFFGSRPTYDTLLRWINVGVCNKRGVRVRLEHFREGGLNFTSVEAINRFRSKLNPPQDEQ